MTRTAEAHVAMTQAHLDAARWMIEHRIAAGAAHIDPATLRETHDFLRSQVSGDSVSVPTAGLKDLALGLDTAEYSIDDAMAIIRGWLPSAEER